MQFEVTILGSNGAVPAYDRYPSCQVIHYDGKVYMVDCGEGAQFQMNRYNIKRGRLDNIFISHLHGDHFFGLMGLLTTFNLNGRTHPLHIYGPQGLGEIIDTQLKWSRTLLKYEVFYHPLKADVPRLIYEDEYLEVETIILKHRLPTTGFLFKEKKQTLNIRRDKIEQYNLSIETILKIKAGENLVLEDGTIIPNEELTYQRRAPRSYAYCADTQYNEEMLPQITGVDLLYHEATFTHDQLQRAEETMHCTAKQAAMIAEKANVKQLLIGHFSSRYEDLNVLLEEARQNFESTFLAIEGNTYPVGLN
ncbi:MAG: ribonuclease Z [Chitinophagales bacterium]|nr:ribonuclease Z [Chitinophagales bacterium]MDW8273281.1 ribonuclease Z [Chitinophagales bacterium]